MKNNGKGYTLEVINQLGNQIYSTRIQNSISQHQLPTGLASGIYFVRAWNTDNKTLLTQKMIVE